MEASLTHHAAKRLAERTTLSTEQFFGLIRNERCVIVGIEPFTNRLHKLIYSEPDTAHFVAIQDMANGEVITVLPLDYHENLAWKISKRKLRKAMLHIQPVAPPNQQSPDGIRLTVTLVLHSPGLRPVRKNFGSHRFIVIPEDGDEALEDAEFVEKLMTRFQDSGVPMTSVEEILLADSKHDFFLTIPWTTLSRFQDDIDDSEVFE